MKMGHDSKKKKKQIRKEVKRGEKRRVRDGNKRRHEVSEREGGREGVAETEIKGRERIKERWRKTGDE